jgi:4-amino-4-deoxychorismate lyase
MCRCFETIKAIDGKLQNIFYHQKRFDNTRKALWNQEKKILLQKQIVIPSQGKYRIKVEYDTDIRNVTCKPYESKRVFKKIVLRQADFLYDFKYCERECFEIKDDIDEVDDILFVKKGFLTDTTIANIALMVDSQWKTPKKPLLKGTMRQKLLEQGLLKEENLSIDKLKTAKKFAIMNALIGFKILKNIQIEEEN